MEHVYIYIYGNDWDSVLRLTGRMKGLLDQLNKYYSQLNNLQAEYLSADPSQPDSQVLMCMSIYMLIFNTDRSGFFPMSS